MCALVHTSCFVSIKPIYVQYKKSTQKKIFATQLISRSSSPKEKNNTKHRAIAKIPYTPVSGCHPEKKRNMWRQIHHQKRNEMTIRCKQWMKQMRTRNRIHRLKQSSWHKKGKYCMMRRPIQRLFPLGVNKGNMLGNEPTINCLADLNTTKTSSSSS